MRVKKLKKILCVLVIFVFVFIGCGKIISIFNKYSVIKESAINHVESVYPGYEFYVVGVSLGNDGKYYVDIKVNDYKLDNVIIGCRVSPYLDENGCNYVDVWHITNGDLLQ